MIKHKRFNNFEFKFLITLKLLFFLNFNNDLTLVLKMSRRYPLLH
ncbi:hypothetical protein FLAVO9R_110041 [Flavobacterium sp. 9R]|nr:hypothetical protein FLAVO9R_110041 [Flavobacterium sp. 9R]